MIKYLPAYPSQKEALARSGEIATALGCGRNPEDVTRFWYGVREHPLTKEAALEVDETEAKGYAKLGVLEKASLVDEATMQLAGWFPTVSVIDGVPVEEGIGGGGWFDDTTPPTVLGVPVASRVTWLRVIAPAGRRIAGLMRKDRADAN